MAASGAALVLAAAVLLSFDQAHQRTVAGRHLVTVGEILAYESAAALEFDDAAGVEQILAALAFQEPVTGARVYAADGTHFAAYRRDDVAEAALPPARPRDGLDVGWRRAEAVTGIHLNGARIGTLYLQSDLTELNRALIWKLGFSGGVLGCCLLLAFGLGARIQTAVVRPVLNLSDVARRVAEQKDYSVRAEKYGEDELGRLVDAFNGMLERIERDADLEEQRRRLAAEVQRREVLYEKLRIEKEKAEAAAVAKTRFLTNMSHELRTPLTAILGFTEILLETGDLNKAPQDRLEALQTIRRNGAHLLTVINDVLDLAKADAGRLRVESVRFQPAQVVADVLSMVRVRAIEKGVELESTYESDIPETMLGDPKRLKQILMNLLGNAIKFTARGSVRLGVRLLGIDPEPRMQFRVSDTGIGIAPEQRERLFLPFEQADDSTARAFGGTGLGLAISKQLAELTGGTISVDSQIGCGSTFTVDLPAGSLEGVRLISSQDAQHECPASLNEGSDPSDLTQLSCRVLVAEDAPDNQRLIRTVLDSAGAHVEIVENGQLALERAIEAREDGEPFDVILMDMQMPVLDGYEATRMLRRQNYDGQIIALTAHAMAEEEQRCLDAGCDAYQTKPLHRRALLEAIHSLAEKPEEGKIR